MKGKGELVLTGQLGDVMKESARIALSYVRSHAGELGIDESAFDDTSFHVHVPAGQSRRDGPSAGIAITTALASLLSGRPVRHTVGMTGEVTLQGRVLPIGGLKQKVLAAHAAGLRDVILPERNRADLDDVPSDVRRAVVPSGDDARRGAGARARARADRTCHRGLTHSAFPRRWPRGRPPRAPLGARDRLRVARRRHPLQRVQARARGHPAAHPRAATDDLEDAGMQAARDRRASAGRRVPPHGRGVAPSLRPRSTCAGDLCGRRR